MKTSMTIRILLALCLIAGLTSPASAQSALTVSVWFNANSASVFGASANPRLVSNSHTDADKSGFQLGIFGGTGTFDVGNGSSVGTASFSQSWNANQWYCYVGVYDGSNVIAYLNGSQVASTAFAGGTLAAGTGPQVNVGRGSFGGSDTYFPGSLYDARIYTTALSAAQVGSLCSSAPANITDIALSSTNFTPNSSGGTVGNATPTLLNATVSGGGWSMPTSGTDYLGTTCQNNSAAFSINSSGTVSFSGSAAAQSYPGTCIQYAQSGLANSPVTKAFTLTGSSVVANRCTANGVPAAAQRAGFTTLAYCWDTSNSSYVTLSNWLDCSGQSSSLLPLYFSGGYCDTSHFYQTTDPATGKTVINSHWNASDCVNNNCREEINSINNNCNAGVDFPLGAYVEGRFRSSINLANYGVNQTDTPPDLFRWWHVGTGGGCEGQPGGIEQDVIEIYQGTAGPSSGVPDTGGTGCNGGFVINGGLSTIQQTFPNFSITDQHTYAMLTTNTNSTVQFTSYIDGTLITKGNPNNPSQCNQTSFNNPRYYIAFWTNGGFGANNGQSWPGNVIEVYLEYVSVWSCANWQTDLYCRGSLTQ